MHDLKAYIYIHEHYPWDINIVGRQTFKLIYFTDINFIVVNIYTHAGKAYKINTVHVSLIFITESLV